MNDLEYKGREGESHRASMVSSFPFKAGAFELTGANLREWLENGLLKSRVRSLV